jgi:DNA-binding XRE family transcriptional regulator
MLSWTQTKLARIAHVGPSTVYEFEKERRKTSQNCIARMRNALENAGIEFINGKRPGVRLRAK